jgi:hypothetical protein
MQRFCRLVPADSSGKPNRINLVLIKTFFMRITKILCALFLCLSFTWVHAQDCTELKNNAEMRQELQDLANSAASKLMGCCSSFGGKNVSATIHWDKDENDICQTRISKLSGRITITMTASWNGSLSGTLYWIKGRLIIENGSKSWEKISDSGVGFSPGCGKSCI